MSDRRYRVAIASCYDKNNYGSMLQAYATQIVLEDLGCEAVTIDKAGLDADISKGRRAYYLENIFNLPLLRAKAGFVRHRLKRKLDRDFASNLSQRDLAFNRFRKQRFKLSSKLESFSELSKFCSDFDAVLVGSDQLWLPVNIAGNYYTLDFLGTDAKKIAYATSFGVSCLSKKYMKKVKGFLESFDAVSVRETTGADIIRKACGLEVPVVCDPTMLLTEKEWTSVVSDDFSLPDAPYVFCYFLGKNNWSRQCAQLLAKERNCKIVALVHMDEYVPYDDDYADYRPYDVGPSEFLQLVANAEYVCTDSFHGTVFSCLFNRPFFAFRRHESNGKQSTNSRIDTLLVRLGLQGRVCEEERGFRELIDKEINFSSANAAISEYRCLSRSFLEKSLASSRGRDDRD